MTDWGNLGVIEIDALKEIGNIGAGNAVTALSKLLGKTVGMKTPVVKMLDFKDIASFIGGEERLVIAVLVQLNGDINGMMMFLVPGESASVLVNALMGQFDTMHSPGSFSEMELSAMKEIGNILASSYMGALAGLIQKKVVPSVPFLSMDMANAILSVPAIEFGKTADQTLFIETVVEAGAGNLSCYFLLVPDVASLDVILSSLGVGRNAG